MGSVSKQYAAVVAPVIDASLATLECIISYPQRNNSLEKQFHLGEQLDMDIRFFAAEADMTRLSRVLDRPGLPRLRVESLTQDTEPLTEDASPAAKRARVDDDSCHTNLRDVSGGVFKCTVVTDTRGSGDERIVADKIRFPDTWLMKNPGVFNGAKEVVMYNEKQEVVFRRGSYEEHVRHVRGLSSPCGQPKRLEFDQTGSEEHEQGKGTVSE